MGTQLKINNGTLNKVEVNVRQYKLRKQPSHALHNVRIHKKPVINSRDSLFHSHYSPGFVHLSRNMHAVTYARSFVNVCSFGRVVTLAFSHPLHCKYLHSIFFGLFYSSLVAGLSWAFSSIVWFFVFSRPLSFFVFVWQPIGSSWILSSKKMNLYVAKKRNETKQNT